MVTIFGKLQKFNLVVWASVIVANLSLCSSVIAIAGEEGAAIFQGKCVGCHTIGKGVLVGPDLAAEKAKPASEVEASVRRMEKTVGTLSDAEVSSLVEFLRSSSTSSESDKSNKSETGASTGEASKKSDSNSPQVNSGAEKPIQLGSASDGENLFFGKRSFTNGGMYCAACHSVDGAGSGMGPDLSKISEKMNEAGLLAACQQTPFKVMKAAYANHPVTEQEAANLVKYFQSLKEHKVSPEKVSVPLCGGIGSICILMLVAFGYRNRNSGVRKKLQRRQ